MTLLRIFESLIMEKLSTGYGRGTEEFLRKVLKVCETKEKCFEFSIAYLRTMLFQS